MGVYTKREALDGRSGRCQKAAVDAVVVVLQGCAASSSTALKQTPLKIRVRRKPWIIRDFRLSLNDCEKVRRLQVQL